MQKLTLTGTFVILILTLIIASNSFAYAESATPPTNDAFAVASLIYFAVILLTLVIIVIAVLLRLFKQTDDVEETV